MRVLILGGAGMLGHKLWQHFRARFDTWVSVRPPSPVYGSFDLFEATRLIAGVDARHFASVVRAVSSVRPDVVVNCIGIIKQVPAASDPITAIAVNALFPHRLAALCRVARARLIHLSTDCVFSGRRGMYTEDDASDAVDLYGRSKYLGEVTAPGCLTLRTSMIGRELVRTSGLVEWFLSQRGRRVCGYRQAIFNGFTTLALAQILATLLARQPGLEGLYHLASTPISKYQLLVCLKDAFRAEIRIEPDDSVQIDRSLDGQQFWNQVDFQPPDWPTMVAALATDSTPYANAKWRCP